MKCLMDACLHMGMNAFLGGAEQSPWKCAEGLRDHPRNGVMTEEDTVWQK